MLSRIRRALDADPGFTLVELTMVALLMGIFGLVACQSLFTFLRTADVAQANAFALADARTALERMSRNIRAANPIMALDPSIPVSAYDNQISFSVYCSTPGARGCSDNRLRPVSYVRSVNYIQETIGGEQGIVLAPVGPASVPVDLRPGAVVNTASQPIFTYRDKSGVPIPTSGSAPPATRFRDCTKSVEIHLVVRADSRSPDRTIDLKTRVDLRNHQAVSGC
jgi:type II secretory pathway pseudopilin PulG